MENLTVAQINAKYANNEIIAFGGAYHEKVAKVARIVIAKSDITAEEISPIGKDPFTVYSLSQEKALEKGIKATGKINCPKREYDTNDEFVVYLCKQTVATKSVPLGGFTNQLYGK